MKLYRIANDVTGWLVFLIAAFTYCSTIEPTASFWDCPEFITTAAKLEVGHPPGAPFFMLMGNFFSMFASDATQIAKMVNTMNALLSAGCILFLFWSITHLAKALFCQKGEDPTIAQTIAIMGSGIAGALIYTWSDTFWFSAVEGEVYAFSSFFTALVFWLILKWEDSADKPHSDRWLVFIAYLIGLSIGVHLLNLLCIPAIVLVYYYHRSKEPTTKGSLLMLCVSALIIVAVMYGVVPGIGKVGGWFELLFVNALGFSYNTGLYIYLMILAIVLIWSMYVTQKGENRAQMNIAALASFALLGIPFYGHGVSSVIIGLVVLAVCAYFLFTLTQVTARFLNTAILCMALITIGYSSYAVIVIRSTANPPMDQNSPEDVFTLGEYLGREQYGDRPLFFGQTYASQPNVVVNSDGDLVYETVKGAPVYQKKEKENPDEKDEYVVIREKLQLAYPANQCQLFPRIYDETHTNDYKAWLGDVSTKSVRYDIPGNGSRQLEIPTMAANLKFFFSYQMNFMYWRYFMWNFVGRQNDIQGHGELEKGNWITGINALDEMRLGDQTKLPSDLRENKGHNVFYALPLILGLLGFFWQAFRDKKGIQQFWVVFFLFFMTGIAIVLYLNQTPVQPRERDYAYAGSFYAFSIWCGLGVAAIYEWLNKIMGEKMSKGTLVAAVLSMIPAVAVPLQMVSQTWDDHDRSGRYVCRDFGLNYLQTVPHDGVIFTNGDNDTFPLWYNEDTEGNRTDVRVCNLSYLQTDWYIDQMKRPAFSGEGQSSPLPISWTRLQYTSGKNEMVEVNPTIGMGGEGMKMEDLIKQIYAQDSATAKKIWGDDPFDAHTAIHKFLLKEDIPEEYKQFTDNIPACLPSDTLYLTVDKEAVRKSGMMIPNDSIPDKMLIDLSGQGRVSKSFLMMLEMIVESNFSRPLYMSTTVGSSNYGKLYYNFMQEGIAWRITPFTFSHNAPMTTIVDSEKMYDNMMNKYRYGNLTQPGLYIDETTMRMCYTHRRWFANLISTLVSEGKLDKAKLALAKCEKEIPEYNVPHDVGGGSLDLVDSYIKCGMFDKATHIMDALTKKSIEYANWYLSLNPSRFVAAYRDCYQEISILLNIVNTYDKMGENNGEYAKQADKLDAELTSLYQVFVAKSQAVGIDMK